MYTNAPYYMIWRITDRMCVPEELLGDCNEMAKQKTKSAARIVCLPARDR